jgi:acetyl-CoA carboxylase biotin carboxyl carrier protein
MDIKALENLIKVMKDNGIQEIEVQEGDKKYRVVQSPTPLGGAPLSFPYPSAFSPSMLGAPAHSHGIHVDSTPVAAPVAPAAATPSYHSIRCPFVGTFYESPGPGSDAFVQVGQRVKKGDTLCIVEAMKLMNEVEADRDGTVLEILVTNEAPVEFDQELFRLG